MNVEERIRRNIEDILQNHAQEIRTINAQIEAERIQLEVDLEEIRSRAWPSMKYDAVRVQTSIDPDAKMIGMMDAIERRRSGTERIVATLEDRRRQIEEVHHHIFGLDSVSKCVLLTLYYPKRTYEEAAEILEADVSTIARRRKTAIASLTKRFWDREKQAFKPNRGSGVNE